MQRIQLLNIPGIRQQQFGLLTLDIFRLRVARGQHNHLGVIQLGQLLSFAVTAFGPDLY